ALAAGFDIIYVYAAHTYLVTQFLDASTNRRTDDYGGNAACRARLYLDLVAETRDVLGDRAPLAKRIDVYDEAGVGREARSALLAQIAPFVVLLDVTVPDYGHEMGPSRFVKEATLEYHVAHGRAVTGKP